MISNKKLIIRNISILLIGVFICQEISHAAPLDKPASILLPPLENLLQDPASFQAPLDFSILQEIHKGDAGKPLIIHIQDAHSNLSGQQNLASSLEELIKRYQIKLVLVEGGAVVANLDPLKKLAPPQIMKRAAKSFLADGLIAGQEYLNLVSDYPMVIQGIEDMDLYFQSVENYGLLADQRQKALYYLSKIQRSVDKLKKLHYSPEFLDYEKLGNGSGEAFSEKLKKLAGILSASSEKNLIKKYPNLEQLLFIQTRENEIDFNQANLERAALLEKLAQKGHRDRLEEDLKKINRLKDSKLSQFSFFNNTFNIANKNQINLEAYPNLQKYEDYLKKFLELDLEKILDEMDALEDEIYAKRLSADDTKLIRSVDRYLHLLQTAYKIQMSTKDFEFFKANEPDFSTMSYQSFVNSKLMEHAFYEDLIPYETFLERGKETLMDFYGSVDKRDLAFIQNTQRFIQENGQKAAFLIAGGYHTQHLTRLFKEMGYSYVVLAPNVTQETNQAKYEKLLLSSIHKEKKSARRAEIQNVAKKTEGVVKINAIYQPEKILNELSRFATFTGGEKNQVLAQLRESAGARAANMLSANEIRESMEKTKAVIARQMRYYLKASSALRQELGDFPIHYHIHKLGKDYILHLHFAEKDNPDHAFNSLNFQINPETGKLSNPIAETSYNENREGLIQGALVPLNGILSDPEIQIFNTRANTLVKTQSWDLADLIKKLQKGALDWSPYQILEAYSGETPLGIFQIFENQRLKGFEGTYIYQGIAYKKVHENVFAGSRIAASSGDTALNLPKKGELGIVSPSIGARLSFWDIITGRNWEPRRTETISLNPKKIKKRQTEFDDEFDEILNGGTSKQITEHDSNLSNIQVNKGEKVGFKFPVNGTKILLYYTDSDKPKVKELGKFKSNREIIISFPRPVRLYKIKVYTPNQNAITASLVIYKKKAGARLSTGSSPLLQRVAVPPSQLGQDEAHERAILAVEGVVGHALLDDIPTLMSDHDTDLMLLDSSKPEAKQFYEPQMMQAYRSKILTASRRISELRRAIRNARINASQGLLYSPQELEKALGLYAQGTLPDGDLKRLFESKIKAEKVGRMISANSLSYALDLFSDNLVSKIPSTEYILETFKDARRVYQDARRFYINHLSNKMFKAFLRDDLTPEQRAQAKKNYDRIRASHSQLIRILTTQIEFIQGTLRLRSVRKDQLKEILTTMLSQISKKDRVRYISNWKVDVQLKPSDLVQIHPVLVRRFLGEFAKNTNQALLDMTRIHFKLENNNEARELLDQSQKNNGFAKDVYFKVTARVEKGHLVLIVEDNVGGVPEKFLKKVDANGKQFLFERDATNSGGGIGTTEAYVIVSELLKGRIKVERYFWLNGAAKIFFLGIARFWVVAKSILDFKGPSAMRATRGMLNELGIYATLSRVTRYEISIPVLFSTDIIPERRSGARLSHIKTGQTGVHGAGGLRINGDSWKKLVSLSHLISLNAPHVINILSLDGEGYENSLRTMTRLNRELRSGELSPDKVREYLGALDDIMSILENKVDKSQYGTEKALNELKEIVVSIKKILGSEILKLEVYLENSGIPKDKAAIIAQSLMGMSFDYLQILENWGILSSGQAKAFIDSRVSGRLSHVIIGSNSLALTLRNLSQGYSKDFPQLKDVLIKKLVPIRIINELLDSGTSQAVVIKILNQRLDLIFDSQRERAIRFVFDFAVDYEEVDRAWEVLMEKGFKRGAREITEKQRKKKISKPSKPYPWQGVSYNLHSDSRRDLVRASNEVHRKFMNWKKYRAPSADDPSEGYRQAINTMNPIRMRLENSIVEEPEIDSKEALNALVRITNTIASLNAKLGQFSDAVQLLESILSQLSETHQSYYPVLRNLAINYYALGQYEKAHEVFQKIPASELQVKFFKKIMFLAEIQVLKGQDSDRMKGSTARLRQLQILKKYEEGSYLEAVREARELYDKGMLKKPGNLIGDFLLFLDDQIKFEDLIQLKNEIRSWMTRVPNSKKLKDYHQKILQILDKKIKVLKKNALNNPDYININFLKEALISRYDGEDGDLESFKVTQSIIPLIKFDTHTTKLVTRAYARYASTGLSADEFELLVSIVKSNQIQRTFHKNHHVIKNIVKVYKRANKHQDIIDLLSINTDDPFYLYERALAYFQLGQREQTLGILRNVSLILERQLKINLHKQSLQNLLMDVARLRFNLRNEDLQSSLQTKNGQETGGERGAGEEEPVLIGARLAGESPFRFTDQEWKAIRSGRLKGKNIVSSIELNSLDKKKVYFFKSYPGIAFREVSPEHPIARQALKAQLAVSKASRRDGVVPNNPLGFFRDVSQVLRRGEAVHYYQPRWPDHVLPIVPYQLDTGEEGFVMPWLPEMNSGKEFLRQSKEGVMDEASYLQACLLAAKLLKAFHDLGFSHDDYSWDQILFVKKSNRLYGVIIDFESAAKMNSRERANYMKPIYASTNRIQLGPVTPKDDIFSLGMMFFLLRKPNILDNLNKMNRRDAVNARAGIINEALRESNNPAKQVILKAFNEKYRDVGQVIADLEKIMTDTRVNQATSDIHRSAAKPQSARGTGPILKKTLVIPYQVRKGYLYDAQIKLQMSGEQLIQSLLRKASKERGEDVEDVKQMLRLEKAIAKGKVYDLTDSLAMNLFNRQLFASEDKITFEYWYNTGARLAGKERTHTNREHPAVSGSRASDMAKLEEKIIGEIGNIARIYNPLLDRQGYNYYRTFMAALMAGFYGGSIITVSLAAIFLFLAVIQAFIDKKNGSRLADNEKTGLYSIGDGARDLIRKQLPKKDHPIEKNPESGARMAPGTQQYTENINLLLQTLTNIADGNNASENVRGLVRWQLGELKEAQYARILPSESRINRPVQMILGHMDSKEFHQKIEAILIFLLAFPPPKIKKYVLPVLLFYSRDRSKKGENVRNLFDQFLMEAYEPSNQLIDVYDISIQFLNQKISDGDAMARYILDTHDRKSMNLISGGARFAGTGVVSLQQVYGVRLAQKQVDVSDIPMIKSVDPGFTRLLSGAEKANPGVLGRIYNFLLPNLGKNISLYFTHDISDNGVSKKGHFAIVRRWNGLGSFSDIGVIDYTREYESVPALNLDEASQADILKKIPPNSPEILSVKILSLNRFSEKLWVDELNEMADDQLLGLTPFILESYLPYSRNAQVLEAYKREFLAVSKKIKQTLRDRALLSPSEQVRRHMEDLILFEFKDAQGNVLAESDKTRDLNRYRFVISENPKHMKLNQGYFGSEPVTGDDTKEAALLPIEAMAVVSSRIALEMDETGTNQILRRLIGKVLPSGIVSLFRNVRDKQNPVYIEYVAQALERVMIEVYLKVSRITQAALGSSA